MSFDNVPFEMRAFNQWLCWQLKEREGQKPTKIPINARTGYPASVTNPDDWSSYDEAVAAALAYPDKCSGIGFVFTKADPFCGVDFDDTHGDVEAHAIQRQFHDMLNSYSEYSPSGNGVHSIVKATLPGRGRKRAIMEIYDNERFFTMTGNVLNAHPIQHAQGVAETIYQYLGGAAEAVNAFAPDQPQTEDDANIINMALEAANGAKFQALLNGHWASLGYPSQSEADFAFVDIVAYWTKNRAQIARIFRNSVLGQQPKDNYAHRGDRAAYVSYMVEKSFDRQLAPVNSEFLVEKLKALAAERGLNLGGAVGKPSGKPTAPSDATQGAIAEQPLLRSPYASTSSFEDCPFPRGLVGEIAEFILAASPRPVREVALVAALGLLAGICGRSYQVRKSGLNQYLLLIAATGKGKEAIAYGISKLVQATRVSVPAITDFRGPTEIASPQALIKWLVRQPSIYSIVGEFGLKLKEMSNPHAPPNVSGLQRALLDLYHKSSRGATLGAMAYSNKEENTAVVEAPAFTLVGESTPLRLYENIDENVVIDGLLPRFLIFEYHGKRPPENEHHHLVEPSIDLVEKFACVVAQALKCASTGTYCDVQMTAEAKAILDAFNVYADGVMNGSENELTSALWNRAHFQAQKLAALFAVGCNYINPCIEADQAQMACDMVAAQKKDLQTRFDNDEVGAGAVNAPANEQKQMSLMIRKIYGLITGSNQKVGKYRADDRMLADKVYPFAYLQQSLASYPPFANDRRGASSAIERTYRQLLDNDDIRELRRDEMQKKYGRSCRAFMISNGDRFFDAA